MAMWWVLAGEAVIFGGLIASYLLLRMRHSEWSAYASHTVEWAGIVNTSVLLTSSYLVVLAHHAAHQGDYKKASRWLGITVLCGLVFLCIKSYEYSHEIAHGFTPTANLFWSFYFAMTGLHGLHVIAGMIALGWVALRVRKGENPQRVEYAGMYWHLVDIVWIFLFPLLYLSS
ncbi:MAG: cytochrome oxidase subunit III [Deltaproteobacteria bacterium]|nr:MAG: cytochrome oxidase subunit III [Deltaproteobacteria bacterium]